MGQTRRRPSKLTDFGTLVKDLLYERGLLQEELARRVGIAPASLSRAMRGKPPPSLRLVLAISAALGVSPPDEQRLVTAASYGRGAAVFGAPIGLAAGDNHATEEPLQEDVDDVIAGFRLGAEGKTLARRLILEAARSICQVLAQETDRRGQDGD